MRAGALIGWGLAALCGYALLQRAQQGRGLGAHFWADEHYGLPRRAWRASTTQPERQAWRRDPAGDPAQTFAAQLMRFYAGETTMQGPFGPYEE